MTRHGIIPFDCSMQSNDGLPSWAGGWLDAGGTREELENLAANAPDFRLEASSNTSNRAEHRAEEYAPGDDLASARRQHLDIGSDVEIAKRVAQYFRQEFGEVVFADGDFW